MVQELGRDVAEMLGRKSEQLHRGVSPRIQGQTGLPASLLEKTQGGPSGLDGYMREKNAGLKTSFDVQPMGSHEDLFGAQREHRRKNRDVDFERLFRTERVEAVIARCGSRGHIPNALPKGLHRLEVSYTTAELGRATDRNESGSRSRESGRRSVKTWRGSIPHRRVHAAVGVLQ